MSDYTYQYDKRCEALETYEWDNVWWEHASTLDVPRVLYIGDSISCATRRVATDVANEEIYFDGFGTSKALDNPYFFDSVRIFAKQQGERRVVLFNNGLHGWHLDDTTEYAKEYENTIRFLLEEFKGTQIMLLLTTHVADNERNERVLVRNRVVAELAQKYNLPIIDLYAVTEKHKDLLSADGVHFLDAGYRLLAETLVKEVRKVID